MTNIISPEAYKELVGGKKKKAKYNNKSRYVDGKYFPSILEANCYSTLKLLQGIGEFKFFLRQIPFDLPGKGLHKVDYCIFYDEHVCFIEAKGRDLPLGKLKRKQVEEIYGITVHVIKNIGELNEVVQAQREEV